MKKLLSILIALSVSVSQLPIVLANNDAAVLISSSSELLNAAKEINLSENGAAGKTYRLTNDIDLSGEAWAECIGTKSNPFKGEFDGSGHIIRNYKINVKDSVSRGIFGYVSGNAHIYGLGVENAQLHMSEEYWDCEAGAIIGAMAGSAVLSDSYAKSVTISTDFNGGQFRCGGALVGSANGDNTVKNCYSLGTTVVGDVNFDSGIIGGIFSNSTVVESCYSDYLIGVYLNAEKPSKIINSFYVSEEPWPWVCDYNNQSANNWYGYVGVRTSDIAGKLTELGNGYIEDEFGINGGYPLLSWQKTSVEIDGNGTAENPFRICDKDDYYLVCTFSNTDGKYFSLENNIDFGGEQLYSMLGSETNPFKGDFDGNGHVIKNYKLSFNGDTIGGLFGVTGGRAYIHELGVRDIKVVLANQYSWGACAGGLVGKMTESSSIYGCYVKNIDFTSTFVRDASRGEYRYGGGLVGWIDDRGELVSCYSSGCSETLLEGSWAVVNNDGGLFGIADAGARITDCYSDTTLGRSIIWLPVENCYQAVQSTEWPNGYKWCDTMSNIGELDYDWCCDFLPSSGGPYLKWETGGYLNLVSGGGMNISGAQGEIYNAENDGRRSNVLKLSSGGIVNFNTELESGAYYKISFTGRTISGKSGFMFKIGNTDLALQLREKTLGRAWQTKTVYIKANDGGVQTLKIGAESACMIDDVYVKRINYASESEALKNSIKLSYQKLDVLDCQMYVESNIYGGAEVTYSDEYGYIDQNGCLTDNRPIGTGTADCIYTARVKLGDKVVTKAINVTVSMRPMYEMSDIRLADSDGNRVYGVSEGGKLAMVKVKENAATDGARVYAALYCGKKLISVKSADASGGGNFAFGMNTSGADKAKVFIWDGSNSPVSPMYETGGKIDTDMPVTIHTIGDSICQTYSDYEQLRGWGQKIGQFFNEDYVKVDNSLSRSGMSAVEFLTKGRFETLLPKIKKGDYVLIQLGTNDRHYSTLEQFRMFLLQFITAAKRKGAYPVLITPPDVMTAATDIPSADGGYVVNSELMGYPDVMRTLSAEENIPLIDVNRECLDLMKQKGFSGLASMGYYINSSSDKLHFTDKGAEWISSIIARGLKALYLPISRCVTDDSAGMTNVLSDKASFTIKNSAGEFDGGNAVDKNFISAAAFGDYDGKEIFDVNGNSGSDYMMLLTLNAGEVVPMERVKLYSEYGIKFIDDAYYSNGDAMYLQEHTVPYFEGVDIFTSNTGADGTWEKSAEFTSLKYMRQSEKCIESIWDDSNGIRHFYELPMKKNNNAKYLRIAIRAVEPWLGGFVIPEIQILADTGEISVFGAAEEEQAFADSQYPSLSLLSAETAGGNTVKSGKVPVITFTFSEDIENADKSMVIINGERNTGLVQHLFVDALDRKKVHAVLFADKLSAETEYTVMLDGIKSKSGAQASGEISAMFKTSSDYSYEHTEFSWTENRPENPQLDVYNKSANEWTVMPCVTAAQRNMGISGGEGGQWMQSIECDRDDGNLLFAGVDVGGLMRSIDSGKSWQRSYCGWLASGCVDTAIDPNNKNRVLGVGSNSNNSWTGIYLSEDMGESWRHVHSYIFNGQRDTRQQLAWDKSSFDSSIGGSRTAYWSNLYKLTAGNEGFEEEEPVHLTDRKGGLFRSDDGGRTWTCANSEMSDSVVAVNPKTGRVYIGNERGFFISDDKGKTFKQIISGVPVYGLCVLDNYPDNVYINDYKGVMISTDGGESFKRRLNAGFPTDSNLSDVRNIVRDLEVSPANPDYMLVDKRDYKNYRNRRYYTHNGGKTWKECTYDTSKDFFFCHNRQHAFAWHPTDQNKVWSFGGDWIASSNDGGASFAWDANGYCGTPPGGRINFDPYEPNRIFAGVQDLLGIISYDSGYTWKAIEPEGGFGCAYGTVAVDDNTLVSANADGWYSQRYIWVSYDGGDTWNNTGLPLKLGYARRATSFWRSPTDENTVFAGEYVSRDRCRTWTELSGCQLVMAVNYYHNRELWGINNEVIVCSYDNGYTWYPFSTAYGDDEAIAGTSNYPSGYGMHIWDMEYDGINDILYYLPGNIYTGVTIVRIDGDNSHVNIGKNINAQCFANDKWYQLLAIDPRCPDILYMGGYGSSMSKETAAVQRSCDRGETWQIISSMGDINSVVCGGESAGSNAQTLVVNPTNGELLLWDGAEGLWRFPPPYTE